MLIFNTFWQFLDFKKKIVFLIIIFLSIIQTILEMIGIAAAIPFVTMLLNPEALSEIELLSNFIDIEKYSVNDHLIIFFCGIFFLIFLVKNILVFFTNKLINNFIFSFRSRLFSDLMDKILHQEYLFFVKKGISKIFNITFNEVNILSRNVVHPLIVLFSELFVAIGIIFLVIITGNQDSLLLIFPVLFFVFLLLKYINRSIKKWGNIRIESNEKIVNSNLNLVYGIKEILLYGKIKDTLDQFNSTLSSLEDVDIKNSTITTIPKILLEQSVIFIFIIIIILMGYFDKTNDQIIIILSFYLAAAYRLVPSINKIFVTYQQIKFGKPCIPKIMEFFELKKTDLFINTQNLSKPLNFEKSIKLENIKFNYENRDDLFEKLNLTINKNEIIGIYGESGTGKSTIVNILTGLIKPREGKIMVDGLVQDLSKKIRKYQSLFIVTSQDSYLLNGSIKENIIFGSTIEQSNEKIDQALNFSCLKETIADLPDGIESQVGNSLKELSSGQKQRISIARSIYNNRSILIFDEATNALDEKNERMIFNNIKKLKGKKTIIIISHNLENLKICDKVYKLENKTLKNI